MRKLLVGLPSALLAVLFLLSVTVVAQDEKEEKEEPQFDTVKEILTAWQEDQAAFAKLVEEADGDRAELRKIYRKSPKFDKYFDQLIELVDADPKADSVKDALMASLFSVRSNRRKAIVDRMLKHFGDAEEILDIVPGITIVNKDTAIEDLRGVFKNNPHSKVKAAAAFALFEQLNKSDAEDEDADEVNAEIKKLRKMLVTDFAEEKDRGGATYLAKIEAIEFAKKLEIGKPVPDIVGEDVDGIEFKLSDYKGKVVVLDFWGDW